MGLPVCKQLPLAKVQYLNISTEQQYTTETLVCVYLDTVGL